MRMNFFPHQCTEIPFARWEPNEKIRQQKMAELKDQLVSFYLKKWDAAAHENNGYLALGRVDIITIVEIEVKPLTKLTLLLSLHFHTVNLGGYLFCGSL